MFFFRAFHGGQTEGHGSKANDISPQKLWVWVLEWVVAGGGCDSTTKGKTNCLNSRCLVAYFFRVSVNPIKMNKLFFGVRHIARVGLPLLHRSSRGFQGVQHRNFKVSASKQDIFNIQDKEDFKERVLNSDKPVLIDFHAK